MKGCFGTKNNSIVNLNNKYNIFIQDKNNIEFYYVPKNEEVKDENIVKKAHLKITVEQAKDKKYYLYFNKNIDEKKEVKKEEIKDFIQNIKKQENYIDTNKIKKITLKDFE